MAPVARQDLNYLAPEWIFSQAGEVGFDLCKADMFSFGCLISAIYNQLRTPFDAGDNIASYKKCTGQVRLSNFITFLSSLASLNEHTLEVKPLDDLWN